MERHVKNTTHVCRFCQASLHSEMDAVTRVDHEVGSCLPPRLLCRRCDDDAHDVPPWVLCYLRDYVAPYVPYRLRYSDGVAGVYTMNATLTDVVHPVHVDSVYRMLMHLSGGAPNGCIEIGMQGLSVALDGSDDDLDKFRHVTPLFYHPHDIVEVPCENEETQNSDEAPITYEVCPGARPYWRPIEGYTCDKRVILDVNGIRDIHN